MADCTWRLTNEIFITVPATYSLLMTRIQSVISRLTTTCIEQNQHTHIKLTNKRVVSVHTHAHEPIVFTCDVIHQTNTHRQRRQSKWRRKDRLSLTLLHLSRARLNRMQTLIRPVPAMNAKLVDPGAVSCKAFRFVLAYIVRTRLGCKN